MSGRTWSWIVLTGVLLIPALGLTQDAQPGQQPEGRRAGGGGMGQMREQMLNNIKTQMGVTDDEWKTLSPKVEKVMTLQREARGGMLGGRGGPAAGASESKVAQAQADLRTALEKKDAPADEITQKLKAYRDARDKARSDLQAAQADLKKGLTPRQEAALVVNGLLD